MLQILSKHTCIHSIDLRDPDEFVKFQGSFDLEIATVISSLKISIITGRDDTFQTGIDKWKKVCRKTLGITNQVDITNLAKEYAYMQKSFLKSDLSDELDLFFDAFEEACEEYSTEEDFSDENAWLSLTTILTDIYGLSRLYTFWDTEKPRKSKLLESPEVCKQTLQNRAFVYVGDHHARVWQKTLDLVSIAKNGTSIVDEKMAKEEDEKHPDRVLNFEQDSKKPLMNKDWDDSEEGELEEDSLPPILYAWLFNDVPDTNWPNLTQYEKEVYKLQFVSMLDAKKHYV